MNIQTSFILVGIIAVLCVIGILWLMFRRKAKTKDAIAEVKLTQN